MTNRLHEYQVSLDLIFMAHDDEEALEIAKTLKAAIETTP